MQFLMTTHSSVGLLTHIRIWHDNKGKGDMASWYLSKIVITDLQSKYTYVIYFQYVRLNTMQLKLQ